jgi:hypothetical protein
MTRLVTLVGQFTRSDNPSLPTIVGQFAVGKFDCRSNLRQSNVTAPLIPHETCQCQGSIIQGRDLQCLLHSLPRQSNILQTRLEPTRVDPITGLHSNVRLQAMPQILDQGESELQWQTL